MSDHPKSEIIKEKQPTNIFKLSTSDQLDMEIWSSFKNVKSKLDRLKMSDPQKREANKIIDWTRELIINELDHKTSFSFVRKVNDGYYIERCCSKNNKCNAIWCSNIDIYDRMITVTSIGDCDHYFSTNENL